MFVTKCSFDFSKCEPSIFLNAEDTHCPICRIGFSGGKAKEVKKTHLGHKASEEHQSRPGQ